MNLTRSCKARVRKGENYLHSSKETRGYRHAHSLNFWFAGVYIHGGNSTLVYEYETDQNSFSTTVFLALLRGCFNLVYCHIMKN